MVKGLNIISVTSLKEDRKSQTVGRIDGFCFQQSHITSALWIEIKWEYIIAMDSYWRIVKRIIKTCFWACQWRTSENHILLATPFVERTTKQHRHGRLSWYYNQVLSLWTIRRYQYAIKLIARVTEYSYHVPFFSVTISIVRKTSTLLPLLWYHL